MTNMTIGKKLNGICTALVVIPLLLIGGFSLKSLISFSGDVTGLANKELRADADRQLLGGVQKVREEAAGFVDKITADTLKMAGSGSLISHLEALRGESEMWNQFSRKNCESVLDGILESATIQNVASEQRLKAALALAENLMQDLGAFTQTDNRVEWQAINQFSRDAKTIQLPEIRLGETIIPQNADPAQPTPLVDDILKKVGGAATLFQRMNESGDMLRVATSVIANDGKRAIGTYIPATNTDGKANPVIAAVLRGETFVGRAFVVNAWYLTAYQPLRDAAGNVAGVLFVGLAENELNAALTRSIVAMKIGDTGYPYVLDSKGGILVHPRSDLIGKNVLTDLKVKELQEVLDQRKEGENGWLTYEFEGKDKFVSYGYFPAWDWVVCVSGSMNELSKQGAEASLASYRGDLLSIAHLSVIQTPSGEKPAYAQVRFLDEGGKEVVAVIDGKMRPDTELQTRAGVDWFEATKKLPAEQVYIAPVQISTNTGEPEIRVAAPVYVNKAMRGVVVINANWWVLVELLSDNVFAKTGYAYILNDKGVLIAHPKYTLKDNNNLSDARYGALADLVKNRMLRGEEGVAPYEFEGASVQAAFTPLKLGNNSYVAAARAPLDEVLAIPRGIDEMASEEVWSLGRVLVIAILVLAVLGVVIGILFSRTLSGPMQRVAAILKTMASGDFTQNVEKVDAQRVDEIGDVSQAAATLTDSMRRMVKDISGGVQTLASSSTELSAVSSQTSQSVQTLSGKTATVAAAAEESSANTTSVAASMEEAATNLTSVASATEEMSATIGEVASNSEKARAISSKAEQQAVSVSALMQELGQAAQEIGKVTETITDISSQTNLLALNATIEAARAGVAGKGFAVVANEIKELAKQTAAATEDIKAKIAGVQNSAGSAITDIQKITGVIGEVGQLVASIATAIEEQAAVTKDVAGNIAQASSGVQEANERVAQTATVSKSMAKDVADVNAAAAEIRAGGEQVQASAGELSKLAEELKALVARFKV